MVRAACSLLPKGPLVAVFSGDKRPASPRGGRQKNSRTNYHEVFVVKALDRL